MTKNDETRKTNNNCFIHSLDVLVRFDFLTLLIDYSMNKCTRDLDKNRANIKKPTY